MQVTSQGLRHATWDHNSTVALLKAWGDPHIQSELEKSYRNEDVYRQIQDMILEDIGLDFHWSQCRNKIKSLKQEYRKTRHTFEATGKGKERFKYYDYLDSVIGHTIQFVTDGTAGDNDNSSDATQNGAVIKTDEAPDSVPTGIVANISTQSTSHTPSSEATITRASLLPEPIYRRDTSHLLEPSHRPTYSRRPREPTPDKSDSMNGPARKKKRLIGPIPCMASKELAATVDKMVDKFVEYQRESQEKFLAFEEKRLKMQLEWEEKQKREEREHQLRMLQTLAQMFSNKQQANFATDSLSSN